MAEARKRRVRRHVIADMSRVHVEGVVIDAGFTAEVVAHDYGYDLTVKTYDADGYVEEGFVLLQLKATDTINKGASAAAYVFDVDVRDYRLWMSEPYPVFLILFDPASRAAYWLYVQRYFEEDASRRPSSRQKKVRVPVPKKKRGRPELHGVRGGTEEADPGPDHGSDSTCRLAST